MSCFNDRSSSNIFNTCCEGRQLCSFSGNMDDVFSVPVYLQYIYDAVQFNLQGMKTIQNQTFSPAIPCGFTISRIADIRTKSFFNPGNIDDPRNLTVEMDTTLSGASFLQNCHGHPVEVIGPDGTYSQKILYSDNCGREGSGIPVFGTQNVSISGNIMVYIDLILCDNCNHETTFTVCAEVPIATKSKPMNLTNFFEICMPSSTDAAFLPRFTELTCCASEARLASANCGCNLNLTSDGELNVNLIIALCVTAEKKVIAPVQMCVLSTGLAEIPSQTNTVCNSFPSMFSGDLRGHSTSTGDDYDCGCGTSHYMPAPHRHHNDCGCNDSAHHRHTHHSDCGCEDTSHHRHDCHDECGCEPPEPYNDNCGCNDRPEPRGCR